MVIFESKTPVLVVEDDEKDFARIKKHFDGEVFLVERFDIHKDPGICDFKSAYPEHQIVIVDLALDWMPEAGNSGGLQVIREYLWPADRSMFFVIFSEHPLPKGWDNTKEINPMWCIVEKEHSGEPRCLTEDCLKDLQKKLMKIRDFCTPMLPVPQLVGKFEIEAVRNYFSTKKNPRDRQHGEAVCDSINESVEILNALGAGAGVHSRLGRLAGHTAVAVFGSTGRLEVRPTSDIDMCVLYDTKGGGEEVKRLAVRMWDRMSLLIERRGRLCEGRSWVKQNTPPYLRLEDIDEELPNQYCPVIDVRRLVSADLCKEPRIRNRQLQILTEMRPVYNPQFLFELKKELIKKGVGVRSKNTDLVIDSLYFSGLVQQFFLDVARRSGDDDWKDLKTLVLRILNMLSLKLGLICWRELKVGNLKTEENWSEFFDFLCQPGIVKVLEFRQDWANQKMPARTKGAVKAAVETLLDDYGAMFEQLRLYSDVDKEEETELGEVLGRYAKDLISQFLQVFELIEESQTGKRVCAHARWLVDRETPTEIARRFS